jgi:phosphonate transport system substrate-binding protein
MARQINLLDGLFAALASVGAAHAQDCPRGDLDKAYCDRDGDLVADAPTDRRQLEPMDTGVAHSADHYRNRHH